MQRRIREASDKALEQIGFSRYDSGELRPPPATDAEVAELALVNIAEQRICGSEEEKKSDLQQPFDLYATGMVSMKALLQHFGLEVDDGPEKEAASEEVPEQAAAL